MVDVEFRSYVRWARFKYDHCSSYLSCLSVESSVVEKAHLMIGPSLKRVAACVKTHVCGHATFSDTRTLLVRFKLWNDQFHVAWQLIAPSAINPPVRSRIEILSLNSNFNDVVYLENLYLDKLVIFHAMNTATQCSSGHVVPSIRLDEAINPLRCRGYLNFGNQIMSMLVMRFGMSCSQVCSITTLRCVHCRCTIVRKYGRTTPRLGTIDLFA